ncbi:MAG: hypothetical protein ACJ76F_05000, partial [Bacteroidia bacterium]
MKKIILLISLGANLTALSQQWDWAKEIGPGFDPQFSPLIRTNEAGELFTATTGQLPGTGGTYIKVSRYSSSGIPAWEKTIGGELNSGNYVRDLSLDKDNNLYFLGYCTGSVSFNGASNEFEPGKWQIYLASFDESGKERWVHYFSFGSSSSNYLANDAENNVIIAFADQDHGSWTILKLDPRGELLWEKKFTSSASISRLRCDGQGNLFLAGELYN